MSNPNLQKKTENWRELLFEIIFEADTPAGKYFDVILIVNILLSVLVVMLDSIKSVNTQYGHILTALEWFFTILFTLEYILRLLCVGKPWRYAISFFGIVDLLAVLPSYLGLIIPGSGHYLATIRILRVLRVFRVFKLALYVAEANTLIRALKASRRKIFVFMFSIITLVVVLGSLIYLIEGEKNGFTSIPKSIYWAIVTLTTVGYGDISPQTALGQFLASVVMILGYAIIAVPTGIVTADIINESRRKITTQACPECSVENHDHDAKFCKICGAKL